MHVLFLFCRVTGYDALPESGWGEVLFLACPLANHIRIQILKLILTRIPDERGSVLRTETAGGEGPQLLPSVTPLALFLYFNWLTDLAVERPQKRTTFNK